MTQLLTEPVAILKVAVQAAYPSVRAGLRAMLAASPNFELTEDSPDVTVADLEEGSTIEDWPAGPAVLLVGSPAEFAGTEISGDTPRGYLLKEATASELSAAVEAVAQGLVVFDPALAALVANPPHERPLLLEGSVLSDREIEVLTHVAAGLPNKGIARELGISEHTVKFHVGTILGKLGAASRTEAVTVAVRAGILPL
ncbi:MAG: response regulator transcription factor [Dehalococcoidia bacterium]